MPADQYRQSEARRRYLALEYKDVKGVGVPGSGSRIYGARVGAGFVSTRDAAEIHDLGRPDYADIERDLRPVEQHIVDHAAVLYGVTVEYLLTGQASSETDLVASRLTAIQRRYVDYWNTMRDDDDDYDDDDDDDAYVDAYASMLERLRSILEAEGHASINAAASAHGWSRSQFWDHVTGARFLQPDVFTGYCLSMGARPEFGLMGEGTMQETELVGWTERKLENVGSPNP